MAEVLNAERKDALRIRYDYHNLMDEYIQKEMQEPRFQKDVGAITRQELEAWVAKSASVQRTLALKMGKTLHMTGWHSLPVHQNTVVAAVLRTARKVRARFENFVLLGIGGSALGPSAVQLALCHMRYNELPIEKRSGPRFYVEDNIDPVRMASLLDIIDIRKTCFNVVTKSGNTAETLAQYLIITDLLKQQVGEEWRKHLIVTTGACGCLYELAQRENLKTFLIPKGVGGRFSELCPVGLLPAAVCGIDIEAMLEGAGDMREYCAEDDLWRNPAWMAGLCMFLAMDKGKNIQVMMPYSDSLRVIGDWYAQLWAESLGKKTTQRGRVVHTGQTVVKSLGVTDQHSQVQLFAEGPFDKVVTFLKVEKHPTDMLISNLGEKNEAFLAVQGHTLTELIHAEQAATEYALVKAGRLNQTIILPEVNAYTMGQLIFFLQMQTAVVGELLKINAYDQPGVEEGKRATLALLGFDSKGAKRTREEMRGRKPKSGEYQI